MAVKSLNEKDMNEEISTGITVVDYWADWCAPCKAMLPILEDLEKTYGEQISVAKVNITDNDNLDLARSQKVSNIPCLIVYRDGAEVERMVGFSGRGPIEELFKKYHS